MQGTGSGAFVLFWGQIEMTPKGLLDLSLQTNGIRTGRHTSSEIQCARTHFLLTVSASVLVINHWSRAGLKR